MSVNTNATISLERARSLDLARARALIRSTIYPPAVPGGNVALESLANTFSRFAGLQTTYMDGTSPVRGRSPAAGDGLGRTVERAVARVLGRSGSGVFASALGDAFPIGADGTVGLTPARSALGVDAIVGADGSLTSQLSAEQAALYRQASLLIGDARKVLGGIRPFAPEVETDVVDALRSLVDNELSTLLDEFGRVAEPRGERVVDYLDALDMHVRQFREAALLGSNARPATVLDEAQIAAADLLASYAAALRLAWTGYDRAANEQFPAMSLRTQRVSLLLAGVADANAGFCAAMDSIGYGEAERSNFASRLDLIDRFTTPTSFPFNEPATNAPYPDPRALPKLTVGDLTDWIGQFAAAEGPRLVATGGIYGLTFVALQADTLWRTMAPIAFYAKSSSADVNSLTIVAQVLAHDRVAYKLDDLLQQLDALADQAG
jgi:hypothetical protein